MTKLIEDYALLGDLRCAALVSRSGSIDWFCPGRFDAPACFAALLGNRQHGYWQIAPAGDVDHCHRQYQSDTLVLETCFTTPNGQLTVTDAMPPGGSCHLIRKVACTRGEVTVQMHCAPRFDYGQHQPSIDSTHNHDGWQTDFLHPDSCLRLLSPDIEMTTEHGAASACFTLQAGDEVAFALSWAQSQADLAGLPDVSRALTACARWWHQWIAHSNYRGPWEAAVNRSLITLKALTYEPAGGMVAAPTTSLPEVIGGKANYDYRFCWLRDAAFALKVMLNTGYQREAEAWCGWLCTAMHQHDDHLHALYTVAGTEAPEEVTLSWLPGFADSQPVRAGNAANHQYQLDVRGELIEILHLARCHGLVLDDDIWELQCRILKSMKRRWRQPDNGIWEFRTLCQHFTHSKVLAWAAYDRSIRDAECFGFAAPLDEWRQQRDLIREDILAHGVDPQGGYFVQYYGSTEVDASLLMIPLVNFLPATDPRMTATIAAVEQTLMEDGLVRRYRVGDQANIEGTFLACSFWLVDNYWLAGRKDDAQTLFERLISLSNDVGLLSEEYDVIHQRLLGNFPQGLSHLALVSSARLMSTGDEEEVFLE
jgi:GH15 family glucan-1,4-alpha-glucosidase